MTTFIIFLPYISWIFNITLVILTFFGLTWALYLYLICSLFITWFTFILNAWFKRKIKGLYPSYLFPDIENYAFFLSSPVLSKIFSIILNSVRWTWAIIIIAILIFNWFNNYLAIIPSLIFFLSAGISVNLDPIFFLSNAVNEWKSRYISELEMVTYYISVVNWEYN